MGHISCWSMLIMWIYWEIADTIEKNTEILIDASNEVGPEADTEKAMYILFSLHQNAEQNHDQETANRSFENVVQFKYVGTTATNHNLIQEETETRLNSGNVCYHSVQNILSSHLLSKKVKSRIYKIIIFPVVLYECETSSPTPCLVFANTGS
jgi:hypothetical protein